MLCSPASSLVLQSLALWAAAFYIVNWVLAVAFNHHPADLADKIFYYGVCVQSLLSPATSYNNQLIMFNQQFTPALTFPLFFMVVYDWPRDRPYIYQVYLAFSTWSWSCYQIIFM